MLNPTIVVPAADMQQLFNSILLKQGFTAERALACAELFTNNSIDGVYTHGVNRFPRFIEYIQKGYIDIHATPSLKHQWGGVQQWDGNLGPGPLNAIHATNSVMQLAQQHGIGCVALANTNHWMRGGSYGWQAAKAGFAFIGWTNTTNLMPAWGAVDNKLGNNPLVMALPYEQEAIVLDMAMSQYSFGALELADMKQEQLPVYGGFDIKGQLTTDPGAIRASRRPLPIGYWKGAGLALLLDILAAVLSGGLSVHEVAKQQSEMSVSQVFIAIDINKLGNHSAIAQVVQNIIADYHRSIPENNRSITFPGERVMQTRQRNLQHGIPVVKEVWEQVKGL
ncbi:3-dehydro-L-gulonate 2-dehydrogenase [Niastella caeni]|uniref:3-dehydro-L-gulonate 2-dehydrogenase n=1 Tax=Niastella caeni TaxID=2569763 RepID=A0A4S8HCP5_9BACT|nr:3-dehydro-L-gulonate 2-dehydrogenase [Niastella caeni]THU31164.1 3-dehydro-L-gulonate 2-dehydrogenase [Niastella caeni]